MGGMTSPAKYWSFRKKALALALSAMMGGLMLSGCAGSTVAIDDDPTPMADTGGDTPEGTGKEVATEADTSTTSEYFSSFEVGVGTSQYSTSGQSFNVTGGSSARLYIGLKFKDAAKGVDLKNKHVTAVISLPEGLSFGASVSYKTTAMNPPSKAVVKENGRVLEVPLTRFVTAAPALVVNCTINASEMVQSVPLTVTVDGVSSTTTPSVNVLEPSYTLTVQGATMAGWYNVTQKRNPNVQLNKAVFMGSSSNTILEGKTFSFEELKKSGGSPIYMEGYIAQKVKNQYDGQIWTCVGFVPVDYTYFDGGEIYDEFCFSSTDEAQKLIASKKGVLYGEAMTAEQAATIKKGSVMAVWAIPNEPERITQYSYGDVTVKGVLPVGYEPSTSSEEGISINVTQEVANEGGHWVHVVVYHVAIDERAQGQILNINLSEIPVNVNDVQPGDEVEYRIEVQDSSGNGYEYYPESGAIGTIQSQQIVSGGPIAGEGFEGYLLPKATSLPAEVFTHRVINKPLLDLFDFSKVDATVPDDESVGKALAVLGYGDKGGELSKTEYEELTRMYLDDYYLDWLNRSRNLAETGEDVGTQFYHSFADVSYDDLKVFFATAKSDATSETNSELVNAKYYAFFNGCFTVEGESVYSWMNKKTTSSDGVHAFSNGFDEVLASQWKENQALSDNGILHSLKYRALVDGETTGDTLQNVQFGFGTQFKLIRTKGDLRITKAWADTAAEDMAKNGTATAIFRVTGYATQAEAEAGEGTEIYRNLVALTFNDPTTQERVLTGLPLGFYVVQEIGYEGDNLDDDAVAANRTVVEVSATDADPAEASFTNRHSNEHVFGTSVVNTYEASPNNGIIFRNQDPLYRELHGTVA